MNLYLVQHAKAMPKEEDPDRPLTPSGYASIKKVALFLAQDYDMHIDVIFHSGKTRALQTAEVLAEKLHPTRGMVAEKELNPLSQPWGWVERLADMKEDTMIVGHLPYLRRLTALLICQDESKPCVEFQNGGVLHLTRDESGIWSIKWIIIPQLIP